MARMPKRVKHRKIQRGRIRGEATRGQTVALGDSCSGLSMASGRIAAQQYLRTEGKLYVRIFPHKSITSIPLETRMGKGKGEPEYWAAVVRPGTVMYEISGVPEETAKLCFNRLAHKLPVKCRMIRRRVI